MSKTSGLVLLLVGCLGLSLMLPLAVSAQIPEASRYEIGLRTGLAMGSITGDDSDDWDKTRYAIFGGAFGRMAVSKVVSFEIDFGFIQKGGKAIIPIYDETLAPLGTAEATLALSRFEIVPAVVFTLPVEGQIRPSLLGGISLAFGGASKVETEGYESEDISEVAESSNLGFVVGAEVAYHLPSARIFADIRYQRDFGDFHESDTFEWINKVVSIGVGLGFKIR